MADIKSNIPNFLSQPFKRNFFISIRFNDVIAAN